MTLITSPVPEIGVGNASEQVDTTNLLSEIKNLLNGNFEGDNLAETLRNRVDPPIVAALPGSPVDGDCVRLRPAAGVLWTMRYHSTSGKWEADRVGARLASSDFGGATPAGSTDAGILTVPVAGQYEILAYCETNQNDPDGELGLRFSGYGEIGRSRRYTNGPRSEFGPTVLTFPAGELKLQISRDVPGSVYHSGFSIVPKVLG